MGTMVKNTAPKKPEGELLSLAGGENGMNKAAMENKKTNKWEKIFESRKYRETRRMVRSLRSVVNHFKAHAETVFLRGDDFAEENYLEWNPNPAHRPWGLRGPYFSISRGAVGRGAVGWVRKLLRREFGNRFNVRVTPFLGGITIQVWRKFIFPELF